MLPHRVADHREVLEVVVRDVIAFRIAEVDILGPAGHRKCKRGRGICQRRRESELREIVGDGGRPGFRIAGPVDAVIP